MLITEFTLSLLDVIQHITYKKAVGSGPPNPRPRRKTPGNGSVVAATHYSQLPYITSCLFMYRPY